MLNEQLRPYDLLNHEFYIDWQAGKLTRPVLQCYAQQYLHHVKAFPRYLSSIHSQCENLEARRAILENLMDEEGFNGTAPHPVLWQQFAEGLGIAADDVEVAPLPSTQNLVDTFNKLCHESYATGLGALYAYERQIPAIATTKIKGLKECYGVNDATTLEFFEVHKKADEWHCEVVENLINALPETEKMKANEAAVTAAQALWGFLSGFDSFRKQSPALAA